MAHPHLDARSGWVGYCGAEPRGVVKLAARAGRTTALAVPQRIVWVELSLPSRSSIAAIAEVVVANEGWHGEGPVCIGVGAGTVGPRVVVAGSFVEGTDK